MIESRISQVDEETKRLEQNSLFIAIAATVVATLATIAALLFKFTNPWTIFPIAIGGIIAILLVRSGRFLIGNWLLISVSIISTVAEVLLRSGDGLSRGAIGMVFIGGYALAAMPRSLRGRTLLISLLVGTGVTVLDYIGPAGRPSAPQSTGQLIMTVLSILVFSYFIAREFPNLELRTKISFGILVTGGISVGVLSLFAIDRSSQVINSLSNRVEVSVNLLAEEQLVNTVSSEASRADTSFQSAITQTSSLASQLELLQEQKNTLGDGTYWDATSRMVQHSGGQYYNSTFSPSSVFIPSTTDFSESVIRELNVTAYLDFSAPFVLENNPQITAIYYTNLDGIITYYPNIQLGADLPPNFNATTQPTFRVATPLFNPDREPRWSFPRQDPAGGAGLITSLSAPVYFKDQFKGVMTADFKLDKIAEAINSIKVGSTGYAFLLDNDGHIISMPPAGYEFFGLQPEILEMNQEPQQTIFDGDNPLEIQQITRRMVVGGNGLITTTVNDTDIFITYAPVAEGEFSLGIIVPVAELTQPVIATQNEIDSQVQVALRSAVLILIVLLAGAIVVSLGLGQLISAPVLRLTQTANQILDGNLAAQAKVTTKDETGTLAQAFNAVTTQLRETLSGLEKTIEERTSELSIASQNNERRAKQFQSISQVARTISSTLDLDSLLTQITTVISREFGFYHVGVFLLDAAKEYAVLSAANSEGGQTMLARSHRLKVGEKGLVGFVSGTGRPRVALDTGADAVFFNNPDLPDTRSEIALPLRAGEAIIGVLDVQSTELNAFSQEDIDILSTLADQVSIAIQNARQNEQTQRALAESEALSRQFVQTGWSQFTKKQNILGIRHTGAKATLLYSKSAKGKNGATGNTDQLKPKQRGAVLSIPIKLRGEVIGSVDVRAPENRQWDQDEMDIVSAIVERAAVAMENSRLLEEAQQRASREQSISELSATISTYTDTEAILRATVNEIGQRIGGARVVFELASQNQTKKRSKSK